MELWIAFPGARDWTQVGAYEAVQRLYRGDLPDDARIQVPDARWGWSGRQWRRAAHRPPPLREAATRTNPPVEWQAFQTTVRRRLEALHDGTPAAIVAQLRYQPGDLEGEVRPDLVVLAYGQIREVWECKCVAEVAAEDVLQLFTYGVILDPWDESVLAIPDDAVVGLRIEQMAGDLKVRIERVREDPRWGRPASPRRRSPG